jgi:TolB-like protein/tRNA A-37 threonylcarbamoyl transferase component Bud32/lipoprotein NlpI
MIGKTVSHYKVLEKIGEGGMGEVYKAEDTKLKRTVALKFLSPELIRDTDAKERFIQEAQAAAALDHSNICTVHEINEVRGKTYITMAFVKGQNLKDKIKSGPFKLDDAIGIITQIAAGLQEAHENGIVHRDIKPANIMITHKGQAKIMDFGLAKLTGIEDITRSASIMGTAAYMSPEQAKGEKVDRRTDIWSLGAVLYEMIAGERPFKGEVYQTVIYAILKEEPEALTSFRADIPKNIERAIRKCLEKDRARRYQVIEDFIDDLEKPFVDIESYSPREKSIVVLPFEYISPEKENEYFSDGLTEEIITDLSKIREIKVISRTSTIHFKGTTKDLRTIGRELNVKYALEGSVRKYGSDLRITAQLIDAENDIHLWAEKYKGTMDDVFEIQEKVSRSIVDALELKLSPEEKEKISERPIENIRAYECYLQARQEIWRFTEDGLERGLQLIKNGLAIIGENALLYAAMGIAYWLYVDTGIRPGERYLEKAEECAKKISKLDPESPHGHFLNGAIHVLRGNMQQAVRFLKKALAIDPNNSDTLLQLIRVYASCGQRSAARPLIDKILEIDPLNMIAYSLPGYFEVLSGRFDFAVESYQKMYQMDPNSPIARWFYSWSLAFAQRNDEAFSLIDRLAKDFPGTVYTLLGLFIKNALLGEREKALKAVTPELEEAAKGVEYFSRDMAHGYAMIGENDSAMEWLENAVNRGFINYPFISEIDPFFENLREEDRFMKLMTRVKKEWENFET